MAVPGLVSPLQNLYSNQIDPLTHLQSGCVLTFVVFQLRGSTAWQLERCARGPEVLYLLLALQSWAAYLTSLLCFCSVSLKRAFQSNESLPGLLRLSAFMCVKRLAETLA